MKDFILGGPFLLDSCAEHVFMLPQCNALKVRIYTVQYMYCGACNLGVRSFDRARCFDGYLRKPPSIVKYSAREYKGSYDFAVRIFK